MDTLFIIAGIICGIEAVMLFIGKDYMMFRGGHQKAEDYNTEGLYRAERWVFVADAILLVIIGAAGDAMPLSTVCMVLAFITVILHLRNFSKYRKG